MCVVVCASHTSASQLKCKINGISFPMYGRVDYVLVDDVINTLVFTIQKGGFKGSVQIG